MRRFGLTLAAFILIVGPAVAADDVPRDLFERVVEALEKNYYDKDFRENKLPEIVERYRARAEAAETVREQREVAHALLSNLPATHMGLLSKAAYRHIFQELQNRKTPTFGFELIEYDGKHYAHNVLEGGPAENAGLRRGDRIVTVDGVLAEDAKRLDWRTDDAYHPDPPVRGLLGEEGDSIELEIERRPGEFLELEIEAEPYSAFEAAKASARIIEHDGKRIGHIHFWFIHIFGTDELLKSKLEGEFADCDALIIDLRGRGGSGGMCERVVRILEGRTSSWDKPVVALINQHSRSAKEVIAYELRRRDIALLVGETTAGAVIPASFRDVGDDTILMFPTFVLPKYTQILEGVGVKPHVVVQDAGPYSAGRDPLLETGLREAARLADQAPRPKPKPKVQPPSDIAAACGGLQPSAQSKRASCSLW